MIKGLTPEILEALLMEILSSDDEFKPEPDKFGIYSELEYAHQKLGWKTAHRNMILRLKNLTMKD
jgi:hypothetical protein